MDRSNKIMVGNWRLVNPLVACTRGHEMMTALVEGEWVKLVQAYVGTYFDEVKLAKLPNLTELVYGGELYNEKLDKVETEVESYYSSDVGDAIKGRLVFAVVGYTVWVLDFGWTTKYAAVHKDDREEPTKTYNLRDEVLELIEGTGILTASDIDALIIAEFENTPWYDPPVSYLRLQISGDTRQRPYNC